MSVRPNHFDYHLCQEYIGCYKDGGSRALTSQQTLNANLGSYTQQCIDKCRSLNHPYAGLQYYYQCFCGTTYDKHGKADEAQCNAQCRDSSGTICGGTWRNSVYKICKYNAVDLIFSTTFTKIYQSLSVIEHRIELIRNLILKHCIISSIMNILEMLCSLKTKYM